MKKLIITSIFALALTGCFTMHVHQGNDRGNRTAEEWHHDGILRLVEFSDPVDLSKRCPGGWAEVVNEKTFIQGLAGALTFGIYDPWNVKYVCRRKN